MRNLQRITRAGLINFKRNGTVSLAATLIMTITLSVFVGLFFLQAILTHSLLQVKNQVDVTVYFNIGAAESRILSLKEAVDALASVDSSSFISAEKALLNFKERHQNDYLTLQALEELGANPFGAQLNIKAKEVSQYEAIANFLDKETALVKGDASIINKIDYHQNKQVIDRLNSLIKNVQRIGIGVSALLVFISIIIVYNTIRLAIFIARDEIKVMRLVGATRRYISGPFVIEGMVYAFLSSILTMVIFYPISLWLGAKMTNFLGIDMHQYYLANFFEIFVIILGASLLLSITSSLLAISRYINR